MWGRRREEPISAAAGRPKLVLQPRTLPLESNGGEHQSQQQQAGKVRGANPFGEARPREEVLAGKGQDWKKIDEKLDSMKIRESRPLSRESSSSGFGRKGSSNLEDRTERKWRKDESDASPPPPAESSEPAEQSSSNN